MYLTSVLLVINENFDSVDTLEDNIKYAGSRIELVVYNNHCKNEIVLSYLKQLATKFIDNSTPIVFNISECIFFTNPAYSILFYELHELLSAFGTIVACA